ALVVNHSPGQTPRACSPRSMAFARGPRICYGFPPTPPLVRARRIGMHAARRGKGASVGPDRWRRRTAAQQNSTLRGDRRGSPACAGGASPHLPSLPCGEGHGEPLFLPGGRRRLPVRLSYVETLFELFVRGFYERLGTQRRVRPGE